MIWLLVIACIRGLPTTEPPPTCETAPEAEQPIPQVPSDLWSVAQTVRACAGATDPEIALVDWRIPSTEPRMWVVDAENGRVRLAVRVAHGKGSGNDEHPEQTLSFSDVDGSGASSLGVFRAAEVYVGSHPGLSLRLDGLEPGFNDLARQREIVVHQAAYAGDAWVHEHGFLGRSQGCFALDACVADRVIDTIRDGTLLVSYAPDPSWLKSSTFLHCAAYR